MKPLRFPAVNLTKGRCSTKCSSLQLPTLPKDDYTAIMNPGLAILLRCFLAFALVAGGIPALSMGGVATSTDITSEAVSSSSTQANPDCHEASGETSLDSTSETPGDDCCSEQEDECTHEKCNCTCPALTLVVPGRSAPAALAIAQSPSAALSAPEPQKVITTLLRPPRA